MLARPRATVPPGPVLRISSVQGKFVRIFLPTAGSPCFAASSSACGHRWLATMSTVSREMLAAGVGCAAANGSLNSFETTKVKLQLRDAARPVYRTCLLYTSPSPRD